MPTGLQVVPWPNRGSLSAPAEPSQSCESLEASDQALPEAVPSRTCADGAATSAPVDQAVQQSLQTLVSEQQAQRNQRNGSNPEAACPATCAQPLSKAAPVSVPQATLQDQSHETKVLAEHAPKALIPEVPLPKPSVQAPVPDQKGNSVPVDHAVQQSLQTLPPAQQAQQNQHHGSDGKSPAHKPQPKPSPEMSSLPPASGTAGGKMADPPAQATAVKASPAPPPSAGAIDRRIRRLLAPTTSGASRVSEDIRKQFEDKSTRPQVIKMFENCGYDPDRVAKCSLLAYKHACCNICTYYSRAISRMRASIAYIV